MASSQYSILRQYTPYISPYNIDLVKDVMVYKQGKVDSNRALMNQQMDYLMGQEIDKPEARAYMEDKMMNVINRVNERYRGADLSSDGITRSIQSEISTVLDSTVVNAIAGTKEGRRMRDYIADIRQNHPEQYSAINEWATMKHYYSWMQDGNPGSRLMPLQYTPYVNYQKEINDFILNFKKQNKGKKVQVTEYDSSGNPTGGILEYDIDEMSRTQVINLGMTGLSSNMQQQMRIEAEYMAETNPIFSNAEAINGYLDSYAKTYDKQIGALKAELASAGDDKYTKNKILNNIEMLKTEKAQALQEIGAIVETADPNMAANFIVKHNFYEGIANTWSYDNTSIARKKDDVYFARKKEQREDRKFVLDASKTQQEILKIQSDIEKTQADIKKTEADVKKTETETLLTKAKIAKTQAETLKLQAEAIGTNPGGGGSGAPGSPSGTLTEEIAKTETQSLIDLPFKNLTSAQNSKETSLRGLWNSFDENDRSDIIAAVQTDERKNPELYEGQSDQEKLYTYFKNHKGYRNEYLMSAEGKAARDAYTKISESDRDIVESMNAVNAVSGFKASYLASGEAVNKTREVLKTINPELGKKSDTDIQAYNLATGMIYGQVMYDTRNSKPILSPETTKRISAAGSALGLGVYSNTLSLVDSTVGGIRNIWNRLFSDPGSTNTISSINAIKKLYGEDFDLSSYLIIDEDGEVDLKPRSDNDPKTIKVIREVMDSKTQAAAVAEVLKGELTEVSSPQNISEILSRNHYYDSFRTYTFSKDAPMKSDQRTKFTQLASIVDKSGMGYKVDKINNLSLVPTPGENGEVDWYIAVGGEDGDKRIPVSKTILEENGFNVNAPSRKMPISKYKSDIEDCTFVDTSKSAGRDYDKRLVHNLNLRGAASKNDAKDKIKQDVMQVGSFLNDADKISLIRVGEELIELGKHLSIRLEGYDNDSQKGFYVRLYDKETVNSSNPIEIASDDIPENEDYADYYNTIFEQAPQYFFTGLVRKAIETRLNAMQPYYDPAVGNNIQVEGDLLDSLSDFWRKKNNSRNNNGTEQE